MKLKSKSKDPIYLVQGDGVAYLKSLPDDSVDLVVTDPPYHTTSRGNSGNSGGMLATKLNMSGRVFNHNDVDIKEWIPECFRILKDGSHFYCMTNHTNLIDMLNCATKSGFHFIKSLVWDKGNKIMGQYYMSQFEYILFFRKGKGVKINNCGTSDILSVPNKKSKDDNLRTGRFSSAAAICSRRNNKVRPQRSGKASEKHPNISLSGCVYCCPG